MSDGNKIILTNLAKGPLAQLRHLVEVCDDRDVARMIHAELNNLSHKLATRYDFQKRPKPELANAASRLSK